MSGYVVIARKWRPALFEDIVGQAHVTTTLKNAISSGRIAHAYLFSGPRGVGKTTAARILAKSLNCAGLKDGAPCGQCDSCKAVTAGSSVDVLEIDGASTNSVENVRELRETIRFLPGQGSKYKVYIIDEVHMLSASAFNALLKTLEEPPAHAVFVLATTEVYKIPLTILSRCQRFDFKRIPFKQIQSCLERILTAESIRFEPDAVAAVAREADGSLRDAQSLLEQAIAFSGGTVTASVVAQSLGLMDRSMLFDLSEAMAAKDGRTCLNIVEKIHDFGYDLKKAAGGLVEHIRDLAVVKAGADASLEISDGELARLKAIAEGLSAARLQLLFSVMARGYEDVSHSAYPRYAFEMALLKAASFDVVEPIGALIDRLERLDNVRPSVTSGGAAQKKAEFLQGRPAPAPVNEGSPAQAAKPFTAAAEVSKKDAGEVRPEGFSEFLRKKTPSLGEALKASSLKPDGDLIELTAPDDKLAAFRIMQDRIEAAAKEYYGRAVKVVLKPANAAEANSVSAKKKPSADPIIKEAAEILGAKVVIG